MNKDWNFARNLGIYKTNQEKYYEAEKDFKVDLNGLGMAKFIFKSSAFLSNGLKKK